MQCIAIHNVQRALHYDSMQRSHGRGCEAKGDPEAGNVRPIEEDTDKEACGNDQTRKENVEGWAGVQEEI